MKESSNEHNAEEKPKSSPEKRIKLSRYFPNLGRYCRILAEDFLIAIGIIILFSLFSGFIHLLSIIPFFHSIKEKLIYFEEAHFWLLFVTFLIFPVYSIAEIIVAKSKEFKNHDDN
ncbi:TPA: hypothetical protein EYP66_16470 [Candidatus Poribacteria bacterium]|nr:hypothetical protein [Candidatus Poribacteria bacterium]